MSTSKVPALCLVVIRGFQGLIGDQRDALTRRGDKDRSEEGYKGGCRRDGRRRRRC